MNSAEGAADAARGTDSGRLENAYIAVIESEDLGVGALPHGITKGILSSEMMSGLDMKQSLCPASQLATAQLLEQGL